MSEQKIPAGVSVSRRQLLGGLTAAAFGVAIGAEIVQPTPALAADDLSVLADRWFEIITGASQVDPALPEFAAALDLMDDNVDATLLLVDTSSSPVGVFTDADLKQRTDSAVLSTTYNRLRSMARAYRTPGSRHQGSAAVLDQVVKGLARANSLVYNVNQAPFDNWWDWQIGATKPLADCLVLLGSSLSTTERDRYAAVIRHFVPDPYYNENNSGTKYLSTGANRVDLCQAALIEGIAIRDTARVTHALDGLPVVCEYVPSDDGLYADGSFIQHKTVAYTGAYGNVLLVGMAQLLTLVAGTSWQLTDPTVNNLYDGVEIAWAPVVHDGRMMSFVNGRSISRSTSDEHKIGRSTAAAVLRLAPAVAPDRADRWRAMCRGWLERGNGSPYSGADVPTTALFRSVLQDPVLPSAPEPETSWVFRNMGRAVHRRAGWAFGVSMSSNRIARYESINGENLRGFHTGAGMTYLYDEDKTQYTDAYWPTVDPYRLAGVTVDMKPMTDATGTGVTATAWAGGAVLDNRYLAAGMQLSSAVTDLGGRKSWFCFDEYVVAMGAGIRSTSGYHVETIIENRNLHTTGTNVLTVNGSVWAGALNTSATWTDAQWAHIEGVAGYIFPSARGMVADRKERTGTWRTINTGGSTTALTRRYLTLRHDHGVNPTSGNYAYVMVPKATVERTAQLAATPEISYRANTSSYQAVSGPNGITMANIYPAAGGQVAMITADHPCSVIVQEWNGTLTVCVAEPERTGATIVVKIIPKYTGGYTLASADSQVTVVSKTTTLITLSVKPGTYGRTMTARFTQTV